MSILLDSVSLSLFSLLPKCSLANDVVGDWAIRDSGNDADKLPVKDLSFTACDVVNVFDEMGKNAFCVSFGMLDPTHEVSCVLVDEIIFFSILHAEGAKFPTADAAELSDAFDGAQGDNASDKVLLKGRFPPGFSTG